MKDRSPMSRRQFLATVGLAALSLAVLRLETLQATLKAVVPDDGVAGAYGQSAYGA